MNIKRTSGFLVLILLIVFAACAIPPGKAVGDDSIDRAPYAITPTSPAWKASDGAVPPEINAGAGVVMDMKSGRVLYEKNAYSRRAIASTTKMMTAILALENASLDDKVTVSKRAASIWGSTIGLRAGQVFTMKELLYGLMLNSGNDAAIAIAEHVGGSVENFLGMMNAKAFEVGARNTQFKSPHGLDMDGHYSTAYDLALIARYALNNRTFSEIVSTKAASISSGGLYNTNEMLDSYPGADGVKTGYTGKAGRCLVTSATRGNWRIISVVLNSPTTYARAQASSRMLDYAFNNFRLHRLQAGSGQAASLKVVKGIKKDVGLIAADDMEYPLKDSEIARVRKEVILPKSVDAPVYAGIEVGTVRYFLDGEPIGELPIKTAEDVRRKVFSDYLSEIFDVWLRMVREG